MTDKPKNLSEQLMDLAEWIEGMGAAWDAAGRPVQGGGCTLKAAAVRTLAERVKAMEEPIPLDLSDEAMAMMGRVIDNEPGLHQINPVRQRSLLNQQTQK